MMTKKDFELLARELRLARPPDLQGLRTVQWDTDCRAVALACRAANPRFDMDRFLSACNPKPK